MSVMFGSGYIRRRSRLGRNYQPMSEINVTTFVDVMLVLLNIYMETAPLLTVGVPIDLPQSKAKQLEGEKQPLTISVTSEGKVFLQETEIPLDEIVPKLIAITGSGYKERIFVRGDRATSYGTVMKVMATIAAAGFSRIALVTELEKGR